MEIKLILPDTNVIIPALGGREPFASFIRNLIETKQLAMSVIVVSEFLVKALEDEEHIFNALLKKVEVFEVNLPVAQLAAVYRRKSLEKRRNIALPDCFIAATCKIYNLTLATLNRKDYPIEEIKIIDKF
jgi:predicted nucleic acid-binding protein